MVSWTQAYQKEILYITLSRQLSVILVNTNWGHANQEELLSKRKANLAN